MLSGNDNLSIPAKLCFSEHNSSVEWLRGGPTRTRTWNQRIRLFRRFPYGADYLFTRSLRW